ncbi:MAG: hypothetical protein HYV97_06750 [Bdellovibrio sp.]|nr:hypothetical protein [Bdellovibrio sp.]
MKKLRCIQILALLVPMGLYGSELDKISTSDLTSLGVEVTNALVVAKTYQLDSAASTLGGIQQDIINEVMSRYRTEAKKEIRMKKERDEKIKNLGP